MSPYQLRVIESMRNGAKLHYVSGMNARYFLTVPFKPNPSQATFDAIKHLLICKKSDWRGSLWEIKL